MNKKKKDILMLTVLGILAVVLIISSFVFSNEEPIIPSSNNISPEKAKTNDTDNNTNKEPNVEEPIIEQTEKIVTKEEKFDSLKVSIAGNEKYVSQQFGVSFDIPASWKQDVSVVEKGNYLGFYYKNHTPILEMIVINNAVWENDRDYYNTMYKMIGAAGNYRLIYSTPSEHPLADEKGSVEYDTLSVMMKDTQTLIKSIKLPK